MIVFFKYFSLASLVSSIFVYSAPIRELGINAEYFMILHLTSLVASGSMVFHARKRFKKRKFSLNISRTMGNLRANLFKVKALCRQHPILVLVALGSFALIYGFMRYHLNDFMASAGNRPDGESAADFVELASGHWILLSSIPTVYFFLCVPLKRSWDAMDSA